MSLYVGVGSIIQIPAQQVEDTSQAVIPVLREVAFGEIDEIGEIFGFLIDEHARTQMILERIHESEGYVLTDIKFYPVILRGTSQYVQKTARELQLEGGEG